MSHRSHRSHRFFQSPAERKEIKEMVGGDGRWTMEEGREITVHGYIQSSSYRKKQKLNTAKNKSEMPQKTKICLALC